MVSLFIVLISSERILVGCDDVEGYHDDGGDDYDDDYGDDGDDGGDGDDGDRVYKDVGFWEPLVSNYDEFQG